MKSNMEQVCLSDFVHHFVSCTNHQDWRIPFVENQDQTAMRLFLVMNWIGQRSRKEKKQVKEQIISYQTIRP